MSEGVGAPSVYHSLSLPWTLESTLTLILTSQLCLLPDTPLGYLLLARHPRSGLDTPEGPHHVSHVLDEDAVSKWDPPQHICRHVCAQLLLLTYELLQAAAGEGILGAHEHSTCSGGQR